MAETGTVVNIVSTQHYPSKFLNNIVILIGALGRGDYRHLVLAIIG
ncbi:hypothetical protein ES703_68254 [subsurface metagenome]